MKKRQVDLVLTITVIAALALLGGAIRFAVLRPDDNWQGYISAHLLLPMNPIPDCIVSAFFLLSTALACFAGGVHYDEYDDQTEAKDAEGGDGACP